MMAHRLPGNALSLETLSIKQSHYSPVSPDWGLQIYKGPNKDICHTCKLCFPPSKYNLFWEIQYVFFKNKPIPQTLFMILVIHDILFKSLFSAEYWVFF